MYKARKFIAINEPVFDEEEIKAVIEVLKSGKITDSKGSGPLVTEFESKFAKFVNTKHAIALNSGSSSLYIALKASGINPGDEVIIPSFTFPSIVESILLAGGRPVLADIDLETYCISIESFRECVTKRTKVVIPTHLYGLTCDMKLIKEVAEDHDIVVIEDAAQSIGAEYEGRKAGSLGDLAFFSFYATKNITTGEGGMITTDNDEYAEYARNIRPLQYRMTELQAAIGIVQLKKLDEFLKIRRRNASILTEELKDIRRLVLPTEPKGRKHSWNLYTIRIEGSSAEERNKIVKKINEAGIEARIYYEKPIHMIFPYQGFRRGDLRNSEKASREVLSLPVHPKVSEEDAHYIASVTRNAITY